MSQLDNTLYIDLIIMFWLWSFFIGLAWIIWTDTLLNWGIVIKYFWLNFICDLKLLIYSYLITQSMFGDKTKKMKLVEKFFFKNSVLNS